MKRKLVIYMLSAIACLTSCNDDPKLSFATGITVSPTETELYEGETQTLEATLIPENTSIKYIEWSSSDITVAVVRRGNVTAIKEGNAVITAMANNKTATCRVTVKKIPIVKPPVSVDKITITPDKASLEKGKTQQLEATVFPEDADDKTIVWSSSDEKIISVKNGLVSALSVGSASVTATAGTKTATCKVDVTPVEIFPDIYASGHSGYTAMVWKNGEILYELTSGERQEAMANSIYVSGEDVYNAGDVYTWAKNTKAYVWKNGQVLYEFSDNSDNFHATSVFVYNNDVYTVGRTSAIDGTWSKELLWKNGIILHTYGEGTSICRLNAVYVSQGDIYVAGDLSYNGCIWKNGELLYQSTNGASMMYTSSSLFVDGDDVYAVGNQGDTPIMWKNGIQTTLSSEGSKAYATSIYVYNKDVYITGILGTLLSTEQAILWKNGVLQILPEPMRYSRALSVQVVEDNVFVSGFQDNGNSMATVWKNGKATNLPGKNAGDEAFSIFVK